MIVQCSWKTSDNRSIADAVTWSTDAESADLEDEVMVENCVLIEAPDKGEGAYPTVPACQLLLSCQSPNQISHISVLCEARVLEVYGHHGEYLKTIKNELLEEAEDMVVFRGDVVLERPLNLCSIKFACLRSQSEMWLYGVKIQVTKAENDSQNETVIPLAAVEHRLSEMGLALSDKAEAFKELVERCQKTPMFGQLDIGYIITILQQSNLIKNKSPSPENALHLSESIDSLTRCIETRDNENNLKDFTKLNASSGKEVSLSPRPYLVSAATTPVMFERSSSSTQTDEEYLNLEEKLKSHMNDKLQEMNNDLLEKINQKFKEIEAKIFCKLDEIESFVKPQGV